jgi:hypothetical protein
MTDRQFDTSLRFSLTDFPESRASQGDYTAHVTGLA